MSTTQKPDTPPMDLTQIRTRFNRQSEQGGVERAMPPSLTPRQESWSVEYDAPDGRTYRWTLTSRIMTGEERMTVGRLAAGMAGMPFDHLPSLERQRIQAQAQLAVQLREPSEAFSRFVVEDDELLLTAWGYCQDHEQRFFRRSPEASPGDQARPRVRFAPVGTSTADGQ